MKRIAAFAVTVGLSALALPIAPGLLGGAAAAAACPPPSQSILLNPVISHPAGSPAPVATGGTFACVSLGSGVIGGSPLPTCGAPGVLAAIDATTVGDTVTQGTVLCTNLDKATGATDPVIGATSLVGKLIAIVQGLLALLKVPVPTLPTLPSVTVPTVPVVTVP